MRSLICSLAACVVSMSSLPDASAATICVQNRQTGQIEPLAGTGSARDCAHGSPVAAPPAPAAQGLTPAAMPAATDPARQLRTYRLKYSDITVRLALQRWFKDVDMQLAYEAAKDFPVPIEGDFTGTISEVMLKLTTSLSESTYPLRACEYDNRVVLVVHRDEKCALEERE